MRALILVAAASLALAACGNDDTVVTNEVVVQDETNLVVDRCGELVEPGTPEPTGDCK